MYYLKYNNDNIFIQNRNKIILTNYSQYFKFIKCLKNLEKNSIDLNGLKMSSKNTLLIDLSSISSIVDVFSDDNKIIDEYIKLKISDIILEEDDENVLNNLLKKYINKYVPLSKNESIDVDYLKLLKNCINIDITNKDELKEIIEEMSKIENIKQILIIYKRDILNEFKMQEILKIENEKIIMFEICDKKSYLNEKDNILFFGNEITQISVSDLLNLIINNLKIEDKEFDLYEYLINKIFFYSIDKKEVDIMKKYNSIIEDLVQIIEKNFNLNLGKISEI